MGTNHLNTEESKTENRAESAVTVELSLEPDPIGPGKPVPDRADTPPASMRLLPAPGFLSAKSWAIPPRNGPPATVGDLMTRQVIAIEPHATLENIDSGMVRFGFRHLPVIDEQHKLLGLVTHRDILRAEASTLLRERRALDALIMRTARVADIMHRDVKTVSPSEPLESAGKTLLTYKIGCLPVVDEAG